MRKNRVLERLASAEPSYGLLLTLGSPVVAEEVAHAGFDWTAVDTQHGYFSHEALLGSVQTISASPSTPLARVTANEFGRIGMLLDMGFMGIIVPLVNTPADAKRAVEAVRYPPLGKRSAGGSRLHLYSDMYFTMANDCIFLAVMLETMEAVRNAEAILQVPGVDCAYVGTGDLAMDLGTMGQDSQQHEDAIQAVIVAGQRAGKPTGMACGSATAAQARAGQGMQFLDIGSDIGLLRAGVEDLKTQLDTDWPPNRG